MKTIAIPMCVDVEKVKALFGSENQDVYRRITNTPVFKKLNDELKIQKALYDIIYNGKQLQNRIGFFNLPLFTKIRNAQWYKYGYAIMAICDSLGTNFNTSEKVFCYGKSWWKINTQLRINGAQIDLNRMINTTKIFDTPFEESIIFNNYYSKEEVKKLLEQMNMIMSKIDKEDQELFKSLHKALEFCSTNNSELISFSYNSITLKN